MTKMNPEIKAKWVAALRSGDYEQGRGYLHRGGFCCLGVACDLFIKETGRACWDGDGDFDDFDDPDEGGCQRHYADRQRQRMAGI